MKHAHEDSVARNRAPEPEQGPANRSRRVRWCSYAATVLLLSATALAAFPSSAEAGPRGRGGRGGARVVRVGVTGGFYSPFFYRGFAYPIGFYAGPYRAAEGGLNLGVARAMDLGALDLKIKPSKAEVWVDGELVGQARDFDGYPSYLWLERGRHTITVYKGGYETFEQTLRIQPGAVVDLKLKLVRGGSEPPEPKR